MKWTPSPNLIAQLGHGAAGTAFLALGRAHHHPLGALALLLAWIAGKEFVFDIYVEQDGWKNGLRDAASYLAGALIGCC